jgi:hypothetical protein
VRLITSLPNVQRLRLADLVDSGGKQESESLLDFGRLGVEEGGEGS